MDMKIENGLYRPTDNYSVNMDSTDNRLKDGDRYKYCRSSRLIALSSSWAWTVWRHEKDSWTSIEIIAGQGPYKYG